MATINRVGIVTVGGLLVGGRRGLQYQGASILITGGTGSVGLELASALLKHKPRRVCLFSNDENSLFEARSMLGNDPRIEYQLGDVRETASVERAIAGCDLVFHAAALKHVEFCDANPREAIQTNILGTETLIDSAIKNRISRFVYVSTDKAVNPISCLGATKLLGEKLTVSASRRSVGTVFSCVRFGNVLGSRGSVLRIFERQVLQGIPLTVTDPEMTRFLMLPSQAAGLVLRAAQIGKPGETLVLKMNAVRIGDLAEVCKDFFPRLFRKDPARISIEVIGANPGEKLHEELMTVAEASRSYSREDFYIVTPDVGPHKLPPRRAKPLSSDSVPLLSKQEILAMLSILYAGASGPDRSYR